MSFYKINILLLFLCLIFFSCSGIQMSREEKEIKIIDGNYYLENDGAVVKVTLKNNGSTPIWIFSDTKNSIRVPLRFDESSNELFVDFRCPIDNDNNYYEYPPTFYFKKIKKNEVETILIKLTNKHYIRSTAENSVEYLRLGKINRLNVSILYFVGSNGDKEIIEKECDDAGVKFKQVSKSLKIEIKEDLRTEWMTMSD